MQRFLQETMEAAEETDVPPGQYSEAGNAQYANNTYDFPSDANEYIAIDQNLDSAPNFSTTDPKITDAGLGHQLSLSDQNGHVDNVHHNSTSSAHANTSTQSSTPLHTSTKRKSPEDASEATPMSGDSKRKRSKVSRACDQCRKKKIRCDADAEGTGQLKTCSNCQKSGQICEYSRIPQKRGPSKGYIKELSERVQQVEGQLALQNSAGYRSSFDGQAGSFADPPFSPDDDPAFKNRSSLSQQRGPFADFTGWNSNSVSSHPRNLSIAVPPDQLVSPQDKPPSSSTIKPFWADRIESPIRRRRTSSEATELTDADKAALQPYYEIIHPLCPILPDVEGSQTITILSQTRKVYQDAFIRALRLLPLNEKAQSRTDETAGQEQAERASLEKFINEKTREPVNSRSDHESLVLLWTVLILLVVVLDDVNNWAKPNLPQCDLIHMSLDLCDDYFKIRPYVTDVRNDADWIRSAQIAAMLARLYAISMGESRDPVPSSFFQFLNINVRVLPPRVVFLVHMTESLQSSLALLPDPGTSISRGTLAAFAKLQNSNLRAILSAAGMSTDDPIAEEVKAFGELLSLRCNLSLASPKPAIAGPAANLTEAIRISANAEAEASSNRYVFNPLSFHTYTLTTITLLELLQCKFDEAVSESLVEDSVKEIRQCLNKLVEHRLNPPRDSAEKFWGSVLIKMAEKQARSQRTDIPTAEEKGEDALVLDLAALIQRGYARTVVDFAATE